MYAQDFGFVVKLVDRGALEDVIEGNLSEAIRKCRQEWTSLPGAAENSGRYTLDKALAVFTKYGGRLATQAPAPIEERSVPIQPREESTMDPFSIITMFGPMIANLIPQLAKLFVDPEDKKQTRNIEAIQLVIDTFTKAGLGNPAASGTNVAQVAQAVEAVRADPVLKAEVTRTVLTEPTIIGLLEVSGGIAKAREFSIAVQNAEKPFWYNPTFWVTMAFFPMMYMIAASILFTVAPDATSTVEDIAKLAWYQQIGFDPNTRTGALNLVLGFVFGGIVGVWFGTSWGSLRKTEISAAGKDGQ
jgi:hypothetical protein